MTGAQHKLGLSLRTDTNPINPAWGQLGAVGFNGNREAEFMEGSYKGFVELEQRLAAGAHNEGLSERRRRSKPYSRNYCRQFACRLEPPATDPIQPHEVSVTKLTDRCQTIFFTTRPQITASKAAEDRRATSVCPLPLH